MYGCEYKTNDLDLDLVSVIESGFQVLSVVGFTCRSSDWIQGLKTEASGSGSGERLTILCEFDFVFDLILMKFLGSEH